MRLLVQTLPSVFSNVKTLRTSRPMARSYVMHSARRRRRLLVREEIHEVETSYSIPSIFLKLRCEELKRHKEDMLSAWKSKTMSFRFRASRAGSLTGRTPSEKHESEEDPVPDEAFQKSYVQMIDHVIKRYEDLSARYEHRHRHCVPFRASKQKATPSWIRAVPLNLHLGVLSVVSYRNQNVKSMSKNDVRDDGEGEAISSTPPPPPTPSLSESSFDKKESELYSDRSRKNSLPRKICVQLSRIGASLGVQYSNNLTVIKVERSTELRYGIHVGQRILAVDDFPVATVRQLQKRVMNAGLRFELTVASLPVEYMKPQPLSLNENEMTDGSNKSEQEIKIKDGEISQFGVLSWGAPSVHAFKHKNGGLSELARKMYQMEEKRLETIESNRLLRRRLDNASFWFATAERELERIEKRRSKMKTPKEIDQEAKRRFSNSNSSKTKSTMFDFFSNKSYRRTKEDQAMVNRYDQATRERDTKRAEFQAARQKVLLFGGRGGSECRYYFYFFTLFPFSLSFLSSSRHQIHLFCDKPPQVRYLGNVLNVGIKKASEMYKNREINRLKYTERRDCAVSMAMATIVTAFTYRLDRAAGNFVELERLIRVGFVVYFENLLSALDSSVPGGAYDKSFTQDMINAINSMSNVCFEVVEKEEEEEDKVRVDEEIIPVATSSSSSNGLISPSLRSSRPHLMRVPVPKDAKRGDVLEVEHNGRKFQVKVPADAARRSHYEDARHRGSFPVR